MRVSVRTANVAMFVVAALVMRSHPGVAGVLVTIASAMLGLNFYFVRHYEQLAAAVERCDLEAIERFADKSFVYRYHALVLVGLLGSVERARSHAPAAWRNRVKDAERKRA